MTSVTSAEGLSQWHQNRHSKETAMTIQLYFEHFESKHNPYKIYELYKNTKGIIIQ